MRNQTSAEEDGSQIDPTILLIFTDKGQLFHGDKATPLEMIPAVACRQEGFPGGLFPAQFDDGEMRNIRPLFFVSEGASIQLAMQFAHALGRSVDGDVHRGGDGDEGLHGAKVHLEGRFLAANALKVL